MTLPSTARVCKRSTTSEKCRLNAEATRFTQRAAEAAYQRGLTSRLQATEARLPVLAEEMSLLMLDSRRVIQSIQLMKSLGGGYQAAPVVEKNKMSAA